MKRTSELHGEWWIIDGQALYSDGDIGDKNHEAYVIEYVQAQYVDDEFNKGEYIDWEGFEEKVLSEKLKQLEIENSKDDEKLLIQALLDKGMSLKEIAVARMRTDAREYGVEVLGWKRVKENYIETQNLSTEDLSDIANGLGDAYGEEDEEELIFTIEVRSNNTIYEDIPLSVIERKDPTELIRYRNRYAKTENWYKIAQITKNRKRPDINIENEKPLDSRKLRALEYYNRYSGKDYPLDEESFNLADGVNGIISFLSSSKIFIKFFVDFVRENRIGSDRLCRIMSNSMSEEEKKRLVIDLFSIISRE